MLLLGFTARRASRALYHRAFLLFTLIVFACAIPAQAKSNEGAKGNAAATPDTGNSKNKKAQALYDEGVALALAGDYFNAINKYNEALTVDPHFAAAYRKRGVSYGNSGNLQAALDDYTRAIEINPKFAVALNNRAVLLENLNRTSEALDDYERAIAADDKDPSPQANHARLLIRLGQYDRALTILQKFIDKFPKLDAGYLARADLHEQRHEFPSALDDLSRAIEINPNNPYTFGHRGLVLQKLGRQTDAFQDLEKGVAIAPNNVAGYLNRATALILTGQFAKAESDARRALELDPRSVEALRALALAVAAQQKDEEASPLLDAAINSGPNAMLHYVRCSLRIKRGDPKGATQDGLQAVKRDVNFPGGYACLGRALVQQGLYADALTQYDSAVALAPNEYNLRILRSNTENMLGKSASAKADALKALELKPGDSEAMLELGLASGAEGDQLKAIEWFTKMNQAKPSPLALSNRGHAYLHLGQLEEALADYNRAIHMDPRFAVAYFNRGALRVTKGDASGAISDLTICAELNPAIWGCRLQRALAKLALKDFAGAAEDARAAAFAAPPGASEPWDVLARAEEGLGNKEAAEAARKSVSDLLSRSGLSRSAPIISDPSPTNDRNNADRSHN